MSEGLQTIATHIQDTLSNAERRARDVGYQLARNAEAAANGVTRSSSSCRSAQKSKARRRRRPSNVSCRGELISEINASIGSAVDRFAEATEEMRKATRVVGARTGADPRWTSAVAFSTCRKRPASTLPACAASSASRSAR